MFVWCWFTFVAFNDCAAWCVVTLRFCVQYSQRAMNQVPTIHHPPSTHPPPYSTAPQQHIHSIPFSRSSSSHHIPKSHHRSLLVFIPAREPTCLLLCTNFVEQEAFIGTYFIVRIFFNKYIVGHLKRQKKP